MLLRAFKMFTTDTVERWSRMKENTLLMVSEATEACGKHGQRNKLRIELCEQDSLSVSHVIPSNVSVNCAQVALVSLPLQLNFPSKHTRIVDQTITL